MSSGSLPWRLPDSLPNNGNCFIVHFNVQPLQIAVIACLRTCSAVDRRPIVVHYPDSLSQSSQQAKGRYAALMKPTHVQMLSGPVIDVAWQYHGLAG